MKKTTILISFAFLITILIPLAGASSFQTSIVPEKAKGFIHLDMKKFTETQIKKELIQGDLCFLDWKFFEKHRHPGDDPSLVFYKI